eukprot:COSAG04_NODE_7225_length_1165_cov_1.742964_1_plen_45_part_10
MWTGLEPEPEPEPERSSGALLAVGGCVEQEPEPLWPLRAMAGGER